MAQERRVRTEDLLANLPLFRELGPADLAAIARATREVRAPRGAVVAGKGEPCTGLHVIVYGQVKLALTAPQGEEKVLEILGPGMGFGEAVMFLGRPYPVTVQALADTLLLLVPRDTVFDCMARDPAFAQRMLAGLSQRLHQLVRDLESLTLRSGAQRVIGYFLHEAGETGASAAEITLPAAKNLIASRLNLTQEHFSRILRDLAADGLIEVDRRVIRIPDLQRLKGHGS